ncbi:hypothetical protein ACM0P9_01395, partial [Streptococcus pluranimalium]
QHSTAQHSTAQHSTAQHSTAQHSTAQHADYVKFSVFCQPLKKTFSHLSEEVFFATHRNGVA